MELRVTFIDKCGGARKSVTYIDEKAHHGCSRWSRWEEDGEDSEAGKSDPRRILMRVMRR